MPFLTTTNATSIHVGFGTAALGNDCYPVVLMALQAGFTKFDTAEENQYWYNSAEVGRALSDYYLVPDDECVENTETGVCGQSCSSVNLMVSTKIPPWKLTSERDIRTSARNSRHELVGFCEDVELQDGSLTPFPLDVYYIHAPACWQGWHPQCDNPRELLDLRSAWQAMEAVVGTDHSARRIGLSNVRPDELLDIIDFVHERQQAGQRIFPPPRIPDVLQAYADPIDPSDELRRICQEHGIEFVSYSTLGTQHAMKRGANPVLGSPIVQRLAERHGRSTAEVVLSWALQKGMSVIPRSSQQIHIQELARLLKEDEAEFLNDDEVRQIDAMRLSVLATHQ